MVDAQRPDQGGTGQPPPPPGMILGAVGQAQAPKAKTPPPQGPPGRAASSVQWHLGQPGMDVGPPPGSLPTTAAAADAPPHPQPPAGYTNVNVIVPEGAVPMLIDLLQAMLAGLHQQQQQQQQQDMEAISDGTVET